MKPHWTLVANASHARLLQQEPGCPLVVLKSFEHPASRLHSSVLGDAPAGHGATDHDSSGASYAPRVEAQRKEHLHFAQELASALEQGAQKALYENVTLYASSPFLGELKHALGDGARRLLADAHDTDLSSLPLEDIERHIAQQHARPH